MGQSRFSGTGWSGVSLSVVVVVANPRATCPFTVPLRSPPGGVQLSLRTPGGGCGVTAASPAVVLLVLPLCCPAWLQPTPQAVFSGQLPLLPWIWLWLCT